MVPEKFKADIDTEVNKEDFEIGIGDEEELSNGLADLASMSTDELTDMALTADGRANIMAECGLRDDDDTF